MVVKTVIVFFLIAEMCSGVIYHLNESEYERMPPLFAIDSGYHSCLRPPGGVYCVAKFELHGDPHNELIQLIRNYSQHEIKHYNHAIIDRAVCVTRSCKKFIQNKTIDEIMDLNLLLGKCINETIWTEYGLEAKLDSVISCDKHGEKIPIDLGDWTLAVILIILLVMNFIGSLYDIWYVRNYNEENNKIGNAYLLSFSIFRNWERLSNINLQYKDLNGIHGIKSISTFFVALAHVMWLVATSYTDNPREIELSYDHVHYQIIFGGMVIVQIFFVISGFLLTYHLQQMSETKVLTWKDVPKLLLLRWARLTPPNIITVLFTATWLRHLGSGPLWKMCVVNMTNDCRVHWWRHLFYINNYVTEDKFCAVQTWHVSSELQLFIVGLIVYVATIRRKRYLALTILLLAGMVAPAMHVWLQDLDALIIFKPEFYRTFDSDTYRLMHILGHNNISSYAIGMLGGLFCYNCMKCKIEYRNNKFLKYITWWVPVGIVLLFKSSNLFYIDGDRPHVLLRMVYAAIQRPALGVMTAILLLNFVLKFENNIRHFLQWRGWVFTSRLSYSVYLLHVNVIYVLLGIRTQLSQVSFFYVIVNQFGVVSLTFAVSIPFYLMLELPLTTLTKIVAEKSKGNEKKMK